MFFSFPPQERKVPKFKTQALGIVTTVEKDLLESIESEHPHTISFEFIAFDPLAEMPIAREPEWFKNRGPSGLWRAKASVPVSSPEKLDWIHFLLQQKKQKLAANQKKVESHILSEVKVEHPNETKYEGVEPLAAWYPVVSSAVAPPSQVTPAAKTWPRRVPVTEVKPWPQQVPPEEIINRMPWGLRLKLEEERANREDGFEGGKDVTF